MFMESKNISLYCEVNMIYRYACLIHVGEGRQTSIHHIIFIQMFANIDCGFKLWAQKEMIVGFTGCSDTIFNQITTLWMPIVS